MRKALIALAVVALALTALAATAQTSRGSTAATPACTAGKPHPAVMTVPRLQMWKQLIGARDNESSLAKGPVWDWNFSGRPGQGKTMVIDGHDVTPVPGYGEHGPFHGLPSMRRGDLATITRCGVQYTYKYIRNFTHWQCATKKASLDPRRFWHGRGALVCFTNNSPIKQYGVETLYFRCCWPRHTMNQFFYVRLALVSVKPIS
jgi:hypothetical protein